MGRDECDQTVNRAAVGTSPRERYQEFSKLEHECRMLRRQVESLASLNCNYLEKIKWIESKNTWFENELERVKREVLAAFGIGGDCDGGS